ESKVHRGLADQEAPGFSITNTIDGETEKGGWTPALNPDHRNQNHYAIFECQEPFGFAGGTRLLITIHQKWEKEKEGNGDKDTKLDCHMLGCLRLSATSDPAPLKVDPLSPEQRSLLAISPDKRSPEQTRKLFESF